MTVAKYPEPDRAILKAFYVQYVSVLLILLSGMIGSLAGTMKRDEAPQQPVPVAPTIHESFAEIDLSSLFEARSSNLADPNLLDAVAQIGLNHDVDLEFSIPAGLHTGTPEELAFERATAISAYLAERGVPDSAVHTWVHFDSDVSKLAVNFTLHGRQN